MRYLNTVLLLLILLASCSFSLEITKFSKTHNQNLMTQKVETVNSNSSSNQNSSKGPFTQRNNEIGTKSLVGNGKGKFSRKLY